MKKVLIVLGMVLFLPILPRVVEKNSSGQLIKNVPKSCMARVKSQKKKRVTFNDTVFVAPAADLKDGSSSLKDVGQEKIKQPNKKVSFYENLFKKLIHMFGCSRCFGKKLDVKLDDFLLQAGGSSDLNQLDTLRKIRAARLKKLGLSY